MSSEGAEASVQPGQVLAGKYQVTRLLGRGGMGVVVEARRIGLGSRVAIKVLHAHYCDHPEAVARFSLEARASERIRGEHSARVLDVGTSEQGLPFIVMELLEGSDLSSVIRMGRVSLQEAVLYILQACEGMAEVHANGIIHRDLKPGNLFLTRRTDGTPLVKVLDFGVAKSAFPMDDATEQNLTMTLVALGTPLYMSPEQVRSSRTVDARTDIWSLGAILYELIGGRPAFGGNTVANITAQVLEADPAPLLTLCPDVPPDLDRVVRKALSKRPEQRRHRRGRRLLPRHVQQHDDEEEKDHDGAGVDDDLRHGGERRVEQHVEPGERAERRDEQHHAVHRVLLPDDEERGDDRYGCEDIEGVDVHHPIQRIIAAVTSRFTTAAGSRYFQPNSINWS